MNYAICNETFQNWRLADAFRYARHAGYQGIEIAPFTINKDVRQIERAERDEIARLAKEHDLTVVGLHWLLAFTEGFYLTSPKPDIQKKTAEYLGDLAQFCADIGGELMVLGSPKQRNLLPGVTHQEAMEFATEVLQLAAPRFEEHQITLAVEPLGPAEGDFLLTAEIGRELVRKVNHPKVRLHLDVKAMSTESTPIPQIIRESKRSFVHFHANDANQRGPGMGEIDFHPIMKALKEIQYDGWISVEVFDYTPGVEALVNESIQYLKSVEASL
jgi:sugar phosphate isomerase/epimerase